jgi:hypothetical protein
MQSRGTVRKFGVILGIILLVVVGVVAVFAATFDVNKYRGSIQSQSEMRCILLSFGDVSSIPSASFA